jgi:hypothetical protein
MFIVRSAIRLVESDVAVAEKVDAATLQSVRDLAELPFGE